MNQEQEKLYRTSCQSWFWFHRFLQGSGVEESEFFLNQEQETGLYSGPSAEEEGSPVASLQSAAKS